MKFYTKIPLGLKCYYQQELGFYQDAMNRGEYLAAWKHLENAHVLGQAYPKEHTTVHWLMLKFGIKIKSTKEIVGQIPRLIFGGIKSFVGTIPMGNTGGSNVSALKPMEIPEQLKQILKKYTV
jgi:hypothetical protein